MAKKDDLESLAVQVEGLNLVKNKLGSGAYGVVYAVSVNGRPCIAKKLHEVLIQADNYLPNATTTQKDAIEAKFRNECSILSKLNHQNIVQFVGVHYGRNKSDLSLVMEKLHSNLSDFVENNPATPLPVRLSILRDVSSGLLYLHTLIPPLIHRDLTAPNILLTENAARAKICDLGVSRYVDPNVSTTMSVCPGNTAYMPPEAFHRNPLYTFKLDIFSYGNLIVHTINGKIPDVYGLSEDVRPQFAREGKIEVMRREVAVLDQMGTDHCLYPLVVRCLHDNPERRPTTEEVNKSLQDLCKRYPNETLYEACERGNVEHVRDLLQGGADPNQTNEDGWTALYIASRNGHEGVVEVLLEFGCDVDIQTNDGATALWTASFNGHDKIVQQLITAGAKLDTQKNDGFSALHAASQNGQHGAVQILIVGKATLNLQTNDGSSALHVASCNGHHQVVQILIVAKSSLNLQTNDGQTALYIASKKGHERVVEVLLKAGCDVDIQTNDGQTALWIASFYGFDKIVQRLVTAGAKLDTQSKGGYTALHIACWKGHERVGEVLLEAGCDVDIKTIFNQTPLMIAAKEGDKSIVTLLLTKGANITVKDKNGRTAYQLARVNGHQDVCQLFTL